MVCPETERAVHTMPASAMTKNMPVVPERPNRSSTTEEIMMVSMVIPDTGFRAVVAMALAATDAKKNENTSVRASPAKITAGEPERLARKAATAMALAITPSRMAMTEMSRSVRSPWVSPRRKARMAMPNEEEREHQRQG